MKDYLNRFILSNDVKSLLQTAKSITFASSREQLLQLSFGGKDNCTFDVSYDVPGKGEILEANLTYCKNGVVVNYPEDYMRRRDPASMLIGDNNDTDKPTYKNEYGKDFDGLRQESLMWLKEQDLVVVCFKAGGYKYGYDALLIAPMNAAFVACALSDLQFFVPIDDVREGFDPKAVVYLAPPFRHTHFDGKQRVVHNRLDNLHEVFSYNLYPGPSAKKGIYGVLLDIGEKENWVTAHASTVKVITPYDNEIVIMHEGASGGGKSEMIEPAHKLKDNRILLGKNLQTEEQYFLELIEASELHPVTDDMALCHPAAQNDSKKLVVSDAENGWFLRLDHITNYGTSPQYEKIFIQPNEPLIFFNIDGVPQSTCLVWEHTIDSDGKPCPNPRAILPRRFVPDIENEPVEVDVRSFGVRTPPCTRENPSYGILGLMHILPPALAWLWRLVAPRGYNNPSIIGDAGMISEGVGSYWPFATGKKIKQANLLLNQIVRSTSTRYLLIPNQHIGVYHVGFNPQWVAREYIARRGSAKFKPEHLIEARCSILGYTLDSLKVDGQYVRRAFLQPERQQEVGHDGYDKGAQILLDFFKKEASQFNTPELDPLGRQIIECLLRDAPLQDYLDLIPMRY